MKSMKQILKLARPVDEAWAAFTEPEHLTRWLAHEARVDLRAGGELALESTTPFVSGPHTVTEVEPGRRLALEWRIEGVTTWVVLTFDADGAGSTVLVEHRFPPNPPFPVDDSMGGECGIFQEIWAYHFGLLRTYLELGEAKCRLPAEERTEVRHALRLEASPERVFTALVEPSEIKKWNSFAKEASVDRRVGGRYSFGWVSEEKGTDGPNEIVEYEDNKKITYTWHGKQRTLVSWTVEPLSQGGTRLELVHSGFADPQVMLEYDLGWAAFLHCIAMWLDRRVEAGWFDYA